MGYFPDSPSTLEHSNSIGLGCIEIKKKKQKTLVISTFYKLGAPTSLNQQPHEDNSSQTSTSSELEGLLNQIVGHHSQRS